MSHTSADPALVPSEVTTGALVPSPNAPGACATRARLGLPFPSTLARYTSNVPLLPRGVLPAETVGTYTQPPEPGHAAGFPQTPPKGPSRWRTASPPAAPCLKPPRLSRSSRYTIPC